MTVRRRSRKRPLTEFASRSHAHAFGVWLLRAARFVLVGWWLGAVWMGAAWLISLPIITLPLGIWRMNRIGGVMTLLRY
jgi:uncharacterized membrane protein YccF (DUF307 family)